LLNAILSIVGSAFATWWAAEKIGWRNEWRVLLALFVAILVAVSEGVLFLLWQSRAEAAKRRRHLRAADHKKMDTENSKQDLATHAETVDVVSTATDARVSDLRQRK